MSRYFTGLLVAAALLGVTSAANATVVFSGTSNGLSASASFTLTGNTLTILLTNTDSTTGDGRPDNAAEVLSGLFFRLGSGSGISMLPGSASLYSGALSGALQTGAIIQEENCDINTCVAQPNIGGEWSYANGGVNWLANTNQGIASSGYLNDNTSQANLNGPNLESPKNGALNGIEFGIVPKGFVEGSGNGGLDKESLIEGTAQFVLTLPDGHGKDENNISNVYFTYGTSANENTVGGSKTTGTAPTTVTSGTSGSTIPEPAILSLLGIALAGIGARLGRRHLRSN